MTTSTYPSNPIVHPRKSGQSAPSPKDNLILRKLDEPAYQRFLSQLQLVSLEQKTVLFEAGSSKQQVYFPTSAVIASQSHLANGSVIDVNITGCRGMLVAGPCCGTISNDSAVVRAAGLAYRLDTAAFIDTIRHDESALMKFLSLSQTHHQKMAKNLACGQHHSVRQRVAKFLLQFMDLLDKHQVACTHQEMADSLGVRREAVSIVLKALDQEGILQIMRGAVKVTDRSALLSCACECYEELLAIGQQ
jgi:CRP-like cAMP-binding protein